MEASVYPQNTSTKITIFECSYLTLYYYPSLTRFIFETNFQYHMYQYSKFRILAADTNQTRVIRENARWDLDISNLLAINIFTKKKSLVIKGSLGKTPLILKTATQHRTDFNTIMPGLFRKVLEKWSKKHQKS